VYVTDAVAALDCGSNSTRLLIEDANGVALRREMRITRLAQGVDASGRLVDDALARSYDVLREYRGYMDEAGVQRGLLVATSAVRDASNGDLFLAQAHLITGVPGEVLSGAQEASYSYAGATSDLAPDSRTTVILDIGGGSTEMAMMLGTTMFSYSMQLGCVRVTERALGRDAVTPEREVAARKMIDFELDRAFGAVPAFATVAGQVRLVGLAGTIATLAQLDSGLSVYDRDVVHHRRLSRATVQHWRDRLASESPEVRLTHPGMVVGREDVLVAGLYVLDEVMQRLAVDELMSSENDILNGITASLSSGHRA
jgi:exopolyphosphatase/guanosine-5'-triphosphate,3'-diphosphate pyrophosphatase